MTTNDKPTGILTLTLTVLSTPQQFPLGKTKYGILQLGTATANTGILYLGDSIAACLTSPRYSMGIGQNRDFRISEISKLYYWGSVTGDTVSLYAELLNGG